jgi:elongation factor P
VGMPAWRARLQHAEGRSMTSIPISDVSKGAKLIFDGNPWLVTEVNFVKPGKGNAFYKCRVKNLVTGNVLEKTIRGGEKVDTADVSDADMTYLYADANGYVFMNQTDFEQMSVPTKVVGDDKDFLLENMECQVTLWNGEPIQVRLPNTVTLEIEYTEPAVKGDTQSRVLKPAKIKGTGASIQVPIFCAIGDKILVNTESREFKGRTDK